MISQELLDEIIYVSLKNKFISKELIERIVLDVINQCDEITSNIFGGLIFKKIDWDFGIAATLSTGEIIANYDEMIELCSEDDLTYIEKNLYILHYLMHEIEHLKEYSKKLNDDYESKIIKHSDNNYIFARYYVPMFNKTNNRNYSKRFADKKYKIFYENNWKIIPTERIAEITSRKIILDSFKLYTGYDSKYFNEYKGLNEFYVNGLKMGYDKLSGSKHNAPIIEYFTNIGRVNDLEKLGFDLERRKLPREIKVFDIETKMMYGFPIKPNDIDEIEKMKRMTRR